MSETGRLLSVSKTTLGSTLAADATTGDGLVFVTDTSDFDETGGTLSLGGTTYLYTAVDPDTGEITLDGTLAADADDGDRVDVWDVGADAVAEEGRALIDLPGRLANDEPVVADIAHSLMAFVDEGLREPGTEEAVVFERRSGDSWTVVDVRGKKARLQTVDGKFVVAANDPASVTDVPNAFSPPASYRSPMYSGNDTVLAFGIDGEDFPRLRMFADTAAGIFWGDGTADPVSGGNQLWYDTGDGGGVEFDAGGNTLRMCVQNSRLYLQADGAGYVDGHLDGTNVQVEIAAESGQTAPLVVLYDGTTTEVLNIGVDGTIELTQPGVGILMRSPDGTRYRTSIANGGTWSIVPA